jgi:RimJ/RimL family protein N-acetyltransferase
MDLQRIRATREDDEDDFASFSCWDGSTTTPWIEEAENHVRGWLLSNAKYALAFRDEEGHLVATSAFDERVISVPLVAPVDHPGWHLQVVAIDLEHQRRGLSRQILAQTLEAMHEFDPTRVLVTANVHREHRASLKVCARAGLTRFIPKDDQYWTLLGEVPISASAL